MGRRLTVVIIVSAVLLSSCRKEEQPDPTAPYNGTASAMLNGEPWQALAKWWWAYPEEDLIQIEAEVFSGNNSLGERLKFRKVPFEIGRFSLYNCVIRDSTHIDSLDTIVYPTQLRGASYYFRNGDVMYASYCTIDSVRSFIEIQSISPDSTRLSGIFEIVLTEPLGSSAPYPDTLHFVQGKFEVGPEKK